MFFYAEGSHISPVIGKFLSWETLRLLWAGGSWEAGAGVSHIGELCQSPDPPLRRKLGRRSCRPQIAASCRRGIAQRRLSRAVFWPKLNRITKQLLRSVPEAGNHHQLAGAVWSQDSAAPRLLRCVCRSSLGAVAVLAGLMNAALPSSPSCGNDGFLKTKTKLKEEERTQRCTAASRFSTSSGFLAKYLLKFQVQHSPRALPLVYNWNSKYLSPKQENCFYFTQFGSGQPVCRLSLKSNQRHLTSSVVSKTMQW